MSFHLNVDLTVGPVEKDGQRTIHLHSLRIQLPEELDQQLGKREEHGTKEEHGTREERGTREEHGKNKEGNNDDSPTEYVAASPRFTWTDEHVRSAKQERFGELLWPVVLRTYGLTGDDLSPVFGTYKAFINSTIYRHSERYPHHSLNGLMEWYVEEHLHLLKRGRMTGEEREALKRRHLLRQLFLRRNLTWSADYVEVYMEWVKGCQTGMNRFQKMEAFVQNFFDV